MKIDIEKILNEVILIVQNAGEVILEIYDRDDFQVEEKIDDTPVTIADKLSNDLICNALCEISPSIPIVSEELPVEDYSVRKDYEYYWLIDPLDGTKEFINRNGEFAINVALIKRNAAILGVVHVPVQNKTYFAAKDYGAFMLYNGEKKSIKADSFTLTQSGLAVAVSRSHFNQKTSDYIGQFSFPRLKAVGSSLKIMLVANGEAHIHPRFGTTMEWDTAAPQIILEEAGGKILKMNNIPLDYNTKESLRNPEYICYGRLEEN